MHTQNNNMVENKEDLKASYWEQQIRCKFESMTSEIGEEKDEVHEVDDDHALFKIVPFK